MYLIFKFFKVKKVLFLVHCYMYNIYNNILFLPQYNPAILHIMALNTSGKNLLILHFGTLYTDIEVTQVNHL